MSASKIKSNPCNLLHDWQSYVGGSLSTEAILTFPQRSAIIFFRIHKTSYRARVQPYLRNHTSKIAQGETARGLFEPSQAFLLKDGDR